MNMQLEINGTTYEFRFGIGFMKEIQSRYKEMASISVAIPSGFKYVVASMLDGHIEDLFDILYTANKTEKPRITEKALMEYLEDESTNVESLIQEVKDYGSIGRGTDGNGNETKGEKEIDYITQIYDDVAFFCFKNLNFTTFEQVDRVTLAEYKLMLKTNLGREEEVEYDRHWRAFLQMAVQSTVGKGKSQRMRYSKFEKFYNRKKAKKELDKILNPKSESKTEEESRVEKIIEYKKRKRGDE